MARHNRKQLMVYQALERPCFSSELEDEELNTEPPRAAPNVYRHYGTGSLRTRRTPSAANARPRRVREICRYDEMKKVKILMN
jgi:hypothetical protein